MHALSLNEGVRESFFNLIQCPLGVLSIVLAAENAAFEICLPRVTGKMIPFYSRLGQFLIKFQVQETKIIKG